MTIVAQHETDPYACLYVIEIGRKRIKVGYTVNPKHRLALHRSLAEAHGCKPGREWVSPLGSGTAEREAELIAFCAQRADAVYRSEYFSGLAFTVAVEFAAELCHDDGTVRRLAARRRAARLAEFRTQLPRSDDGIVRMAGSIEEAAQWLRLPESHVQDLVVSGWLPVIRHGRHGRYKRISVSALERFV